MALIMLSSPLHPPLPNQDARALKLMALIMLSPPLHPPLPNQDARAHKLVALMLKYFKKTKVAEPLQVGCQADVLLTNLLTD